jgi:hypothetical protein
MRGLRVGSPLAFHLDDQSFQQIWKATTVFTDAVRIILPAGPLEGGDGEFPAGVGFGGHRSVGKLTDRLPAASLNFRQKPAWRSGLCFPALRPASVLATRGVNAAIIR